MPTDADLQAMSTMIQAALSASTKELVKFADKAKESAGPSGGLMSVGNITTSDQVNTILAAGRADLVALGRPHLVDPS